MRVGWKLNQLTTSRPVSSSRCDLGPSPTPPPALCPRPRSEEETNSLCLSDATLNSLNVSGETGADFRAVPNVFFVQSFC